MKKAVWFITLAMMVALVGLVGTPATAATLQVDDDGVECPAATFTSIQAAVTAAAPGDTIQVCEGTYPLTATISLTKPVTLQGPNHSNDPTGGGARLGEATITFGGATRGLRVRSGDVTIEGFSFEGFSNAGTNTAIWHNGADSVNGLTIEDNIFDNNSQAFSTSKAGAGSPNELMNLAIRSNLITDNSVRAISSYTGVLGSDFTISGNEFIGALVPIHLGFVDGVTITDNSVQMTDPWYAIFFADDIADITVMGNVLDGGNIAHLGIFVWGKTNVLGPVSVDENDIKNFVSYGVDIRQDAGETTDVSQWNVNENNIVGNGLLGVRNNGTGTLNAECNWWGAANGPAAADNPGGTGDGVSANVDYRPWLTTSAPGGECTVDTPPTKNDCNKNGWMSRTDDEGRSFKNQGDCMSYVATGGNNKAKN